MAKLIPQISNNGVTALQAGVNNTTDVTLVVVDGSVFPQFRQQEGSPLVDSNKYCAVTVVSVADPTVFEIMHVTDVNGNNFTVERAQEGTAKQTFVAGDIVSHRFTAEVINQVVAYAKAGKDLADLFPSVDGAVVATDEDISLLAGLAAASESVATEAYADASATTAAASMGSGIADGATGFPIPVRLGRPGWLANLGNGADVDHSANANIAAGFHYAKDFTIGAGVTLTMNTSGPLIIMCAGTFSMTATSKIDAKGRGVPGAAPGFDGAPGYLGGNGGGGSGTGFLGSTPTTAGGVSQVQSAPSVAQLDAMAAFGGLDWTMLDYGGGAAGGGAIDFSGPDAAGGSGGPLVIIIAGTDIDIPVGAEIDVSGGDGEDFAGADGGGGGGGAIILIAPAFSNDAGAYTVAGGVGPGEATDGQPGWKASLLMPALGQVAV